MAKIKKDAPSETPKREHFAPGSPELHQLRLRARPQRPVDGRAPYTEPLHELGYGERFFVPQSPDGGLLVLGEGCFPSELDSLVLSLPDAVGLPLSAYIVLELSKRTQQMRTS